MKSWPRAVAVLGAADCDARLGRAAFEVGRELARRDVVLVCGGRGGVMAEAARGAVEAGGRTVGILPGTSAANSAPNDHIQTAIFTGLGQARNQVVVLSAGAAIAVGGGWGTLSEIALALKHRIPVVLLHSWELARPDRRAEPLLSRAETAAEAVDRAIAPLGSPPPAGATEEP